MPSLPSPVPSDSSITSSGMMGRRSTSARSPGYYQNEGSDHNSNGISEPRDEMNVITLKHLENDDSMKCL